MPTYQPGWYHRLISNTVHDMIHGPLRRLIISLPPRHGKSELISRRLPAYLLGVNPNTSIIAASYSADLASRNNRDVQRIIDSSLYKTLFPTTRLNEGNSRTVSVNWLRNSDLFEIVGHKGVYRSAGVGGGITGMGGQWLIVDDPVKNREEADSATYRQATWDWYTSTFSTRQEADARILIVMTRWHSDDLVGRLLDLAVNEPQADQWTVINLPAISDRGDKPLYDPRAESEPLWPERFGIDDLMRMKASIGEYQWSALYQQKPRSGGGTEWPDSYFPKSIWFDEWPKTISLKTIGVDPSKGRDGKHGDYSSIVKLGRDTDGTLYVEADMARMNSELIVSTVLETQRNYRADAIAIETNQFQELLAVQLQERARSAGMGIPIVPIVNTVSKNVRIRRLGPYLGQTQIRFKAGSAGTKLLVDQLRDFPVSEYDDGPDSLEMALRVMIDIHNGKANRLSRGVRI
jgi:predicted phage terminase large subunit-like protein